MSGQLTLGVRLRDTSRFASYHAGPNERVVHTLRAALMREGPMCLWLHGPRGVGKTHLLQAVCAAAGEHGQSAAYLPLGELTGVAPDVLSGFGGVSFVGIDDVDTAVGDGSWERALFNLYRELDERGGRLVVASSVVPASLPFVLPDLASRFAASLTLILQTLDEDDQVKALQLRARLRGFELPEDSAGYLLRRLPRDMTSLSSFLDELDEASLAAQRRLTVPFVRQVMDRRRDVTSDE